MCSARPCWEAIPDPICVLTLLLCRLQACRHYIDGRGSRVCVWDGFDERGDGILGAGGVRWQRLRFGERCPAGARASCGCTRRVGCAAPCVPASSRQAVENAGLGLLWGWAKPGCVGVARVALARVLVGSAASHRRIPIQMYGLSCGLLLGTTHPSRTPLSLA